MFLTIIEECKGVGVIKSIELRIISSIQVTDIKFAFRRVKSARAFYSILMVISTIMTTVFLIGLSTDNFPRLTYASQVQALRRSAFARTKTFTKPRVLSNEEGA